MTTPTLALYQNYGFRLPDDAFEPVPGGLLYFYLAGTTTPVTVYSDDMGSIPLSNPVVADGFGLFPSIYMNPNDYKIVAQDANNVTLWTVDDWELLAPSILDSNYFQLIDGVYVPIIQPNNQTGTGYTVQDSDRASLIIMSNNTGGTVTFPDPTGTTFLDGWYVYVSNISSAAYTLTSTANINGVTNYVLPPGTFTLIDSTGATYFAGASSFTTAGPFTFQGNTGNSTTSPMANPLSLMQAFNPLAGLKITFDAVQYNTTVNITGLNIPTSIPLNISTNGVNGLDTGTVAASTWYYMYLMVNPALVGSTPLGTLAAVFSTSPPTSLSGIIFPTGYVYVAYLGSRLTDASSHLYQFIQYGNRVQVVLGINPTNTTPFTIATGAQGSGSQGTPTYASASISNFCSPLATAIELWIGDIGNPGTPTRVFAAPSTSYGGEPGDNPPYLTTSSQTNDTTATTGSMVLESASNIGIWSPDSGAAWIIRGWWERM